MKESSGRADAFRFEPAFWAKYLAGKPEYLNEEPRRVASSYGLMQVMYSTAREHGYSGDPELLFNIPINLEIGCTVLAALWAWAGGDKRKALAAYNGGQGNWRAQAPQRYAEDVLQKWEALKG